uniref:Secreted protein n=1 Tax=Ixodes ricinus TaxID=34613 RepID=A0A6B0U5Z9_IXORI
MIFFSRAWSFCIRLSCSSLAVLSWCSRVSSSAANRSLSSCARSFFSDSSFRSATISSWISRIRSSEMAFFRFLRPFLSPLSSLASSLLSSSGVDGSTPS